MKILILVSFITLIVSCSENNESVLEVSESINKTEYSDNIDCPEWPNDTILDSGDFVSYIKENGRVKIKWGNPSFNRTLDKSYDCNSAPAWMPTIKWATEEYIGLRYGCGNPCWGTFILPLNQTDSVIERMYQFDRDIDRNLIVYLGSEDYNTLIVENWKTGKKQRIETKYTCESAFLGYCLDSIKLNQTILYIRWKNVEGKEMGVDKIDLKI